MLPNGSTPLEELYGFQLVNSTEVLTNEGSAATGFNCGAPPEPTVSRINDLKSYDIRNNMLNVGKHTT